MSEKVAVRDINKEILQIASGIVMKDASETPKLSPATFSTVGVNSLVVPENAAFLMLKNDKAIKLHRSPTVADGYVNLAESDRFQMFPVGNTDVFYFTITEETITEFYFVVM